MQKQIIIFSYLLNTIDVYTDAIKGKLKVLKDSKNSTNITIPSEAAPQSAIKAKNN